MKTIEDLNYWKKNAEEDYMKVPISVLRYITKLETKLTEPKEPELPTPTDCPTCGEPTIVNEKEKWSCLTCQDSGIKEPVKSADVDLDQSIETILFSAFTKGKENNYYFKEWFERNNVLDRVKDLFINQSHPVKSEANVLSYGEFCSWFDDYDQSNGRKMLFQLDDKDISELYDFCQGMFSTVKTEVREDEYEVLRVLIKEADDLKTHIVDRGYIDWDDESIEGCKNFDSAIKIAQEYLNKSNVKTELSDSDIESLLLIKKQFEIIRGETADNSIKNEPRPFYVSNFRKILQLHDNTEISFGRMVELLNETAREFYKGLTIKQKGGEEAIKLIEKLRESIISVDINVIDNPEISDFVIRDLFNQCNKLYDLFTQNPKQ